MLGELRSSTPFLTLLFGLSVGINYCWEMVQMPLYRNMPFDEVSSWVMCFRASLGDGVIILAIWSVGYVIFRERHWVAFKADRLTVLLLAGTVIAVTIEVHATNTGRWSYSSYMPLIPPLDVGLSPVLQMLLLPALSIKWARRIRSRQRKTG
jgi:hypothetical protein